MGHVMGRSSHGKRGLLATILRSTGPVPLTTEDDNLADFKTMYGLASSWFECNCVEYYEFASSRFECSGAVNARVGQTLRHETAI
jgi:hypothetical protein